MAFSFLQSHTEGDPTFVFPIAVTAGSLFVFGFRWEGATGSGNMIGSQQGGGSITMLTRVDNAAGDHHAQMGYLLTNNGSETFDLTFPASSGFVEVSGAEFSYTDTPTIDTSNTGSGSGTALASGAINLDSGASDWVTVGFGSSYSSGQTYSAQAVNGVAAAGSVLGFAAYTTLFWRLLSTTGFSGGTATCTASVSDAWACNVLAIKSGTAAGGSPGVIGRRIYVLP